MNGVLGPFTKIPSPDGVVVIGVSICVNLPPGTVISGHRTDRERWENDEYIVFLDKYAGAIGETVTVWELSILRHDGDVAHDWRDLQAIKTALAGPDYEALELYPAENRVIDVANETHLFVLVKSDTSGPIKIHVGRDGRREVNSLLTRGQRPLS